MDSFVILLIAGIGMSLFSALIVGMYAILEAENKKKEIRRYVRKQIIKQMEKEKAAQENIEQQLY